MKDANAKPAFCHQHGVGGGGLVSLPNQSLQHDASWALVNIWQVLNQLTWLVYGH